MATPEERLNDMLDRFEAAHRTDTRNPGAHLRGLIESTPQLKAELLESVRRGHLDGIVGIDGDRPLGAYSAEQRLLAVSLGQLNDAPANTHIANSLRFTLGHEGRHAVDGQAILDQNDALRDQARATARSPSPHDHTETLRAYDATSRTLETRAEIAGFNTLASYVTARNPQATLKDLYDASPDDMRMYIRRDFSVSPPAYVAKPGLTIGADLQIASTPENVAAMGRLFYDANGYPATETAIALRTVCNEEIAALAEARAADPRAPAPEIRVNLTELGFPGAALPPGFTDSSRPRFEPQMAPQDSAPQAPVHGALDPRSASHPDNGFFQALRERLPASVPDNAVARAMYLAKGEGMTDFTKVNPQEIALADGKVWIGGHAPGVRIGADIAQAPPMDQVGQDLKSQPQPAQPPLQDAMRAQEASARAM